LSVFLLAQPGVAPQAQLDEAEKTIFIFAYFAEHFYVCSDLCQIFYLFFLTFQIFQP